MAKSIRPRCGLREYRMLAPSDRESENPSPVPVIPPVARVPVADGVALLGFMVAGCQDPSQSDTEQAGTATASVARRAKRLAA
jgi:hypothetical protein